jgi:hypothetical protein
VLINRSCSFSIVSETQRRPCIVDGCCEPRSIEGQYGAARTKQVIFPHKAVLSGNVCPHRSVMSALK